MDLNRRQFLKGTAAIGGVAALGGLMTGCQPSKKVDQASSSSTIPYPEGTTSQDFQNSVVELEPIASFADEKTYDIVVIGAGTAGIPQYARRSKKAPQSPACKKRPSLSRTATALRDPSSRKAMPSGSCNTNKHGAPQAATA